MVGGAHSDHGPLLTGLQPSAEYYYRLQGVGEDGRLYRSEIMTFRTPAAVEAGPNRNLAAQGSVVDVSSEFSESFAAANAIDDDPATEWSTRDDGDGAYLIIDLGRVVDAVGVSFVTREMSDGTATTTTFSVTVDDLETFGPFPASPDPTVVDVEFSGQLIRFDVETSTGGNTGAIEVAVYEQP